MLLPPPNNVAFYYVVPRNISHGISIVRGGGGVRVKKRCARLPEQIIEIINYTRGGIVIFFTDNKRERVYWGANSSPGYRARRLLAELMLP